MTLALVDGSKFRDAYFKAVQERSGVRIGVMQLRWERVGCVP
jgi:hypothetical protein